MAASGLEQITTNFHTIFFFGGGEGRFFFLSQATRGGERIYIFLVQ